MRRSLLVLWGVASGLAVAAPAADGAAGAGPGDLASGQSHSRARATMVQAAAGPRNDYALQTS